jgi:Sap, sulfolipid-1-addressing protein
MNTQILPLAITMMAGPQILSAIIFITGRRPRPTSLAFISAVPLAMSLMILIFMGIASLFDLQEGSEPSSGATTVQIVLVGLLILASIRTFLRRESVEPPKWLGALQEASPRRAFAVGFLLLSVFPSDFVVLLTTGINLESNGNSYTDALPFIGLTTLIAALPFLSYMLFRRRAEVAMPKVRDWMNANSWVVNIVVYAIFIVLIL